MNKRPLVSIIIPTYNRAHLIGETLDSVLAQTYANWECIVVDDGSTDGTTEVMQMYLEKDARFRYYNRPDEHLPGGNGARSYGFKVSRGDYIQWLDSDDLLEEQKIYKQLELLLRSECKVCVSNAVIFVDTPYKGKLKLWSKELNAENVQDALITQKMRWANGTLLIKKEVINPKFWDENLFGGQEWLFHILLSLSLTDKDFCFINDSLLLIRGSHDSITSSINSKRYENYLLARLKLLKFLKIHYPLLSNKYFFVTSRISVKYMRVLINENKFRVIWEYYLFVLNKSLVVAFYFFYAILVFKLFRKDIYLRKCFGKYN
ncbi:glycosyltransferase family 2 protein [Aestuariibaculum sp. M13]|uniref:glycosyltransferase family 2 protein n=1 Tax=Aestuariibaculum sp. M13 TaxID=2967132 RepID=UPI00215A04A2|nr:glycosyltransferase family 2 protein [Aestuariibaculum sp. M13]MCR8666363.1 glycosyltransferase family 2 protein [Aestuariibaculum sp. M13]